MLHLLTIGYRYRVPKECEILKWFEINDRRAVDIILRSNQSYKKLPPLPLYVVLYLTDVIILIYISEWRANGASSGDVSTGDIIFSGWKQVFTHVDLEYKILFFIIMTKFADLFISYGKQFVEFQSFGNHINLARIDPGFLKWHQSGQTKYIALCGTMPSKAAICLNVVRIKECGIENPFYVPRAGRMDSLLIRGITGMFLLKKLYNNY